MIRRLYRSAVTLVFMSGDSVEEGRGFTDQSANPVRETRSLYNCNLSTNYSLMLLNVKYVV